MKFTQNEIEKLEAFWDTIETSGIKAVARDFGCHYTIMYGFVAVMRKVAGIPVPIRPKVRALTFAERREYLEWKAKGGKL